ncbi:MAG: ATP-grasp domain-containing protein [Opitutales bacterium]|nr:ATP-grasp domain-containing protein [Opitutales bacterium]
MSKSKIGLIFPNRHDNSLPLAKSKDAFEQAGICIAISSLETIELCIHNRKTASFLMTNGIPAPQTFIFEKLNRDRLFQNLPLISKTVNGSSSEGIQIIRKTEELPDNPLPQSTLYQSIAPGDEYTINVYVAKTDKCLCTIPHRRLLVKNRESVQADHRTKRSARQASPFYIGGSTKSMGPFEFPSFLRPQDKRSSNNRN